MGITLIYQALRFVVLSAFVVGSLASPLLGQGKGKKVSYSIKEYQVYNAAVSLKDTAKREAAILGYLKSKPNAELYKYALNNYLALIQASQKKGDYKRVLSAGEKLLKVEPNNMSAVGASLDAAYRLQQHKKVVLYGEKVYATKPSAGIALALSQAFVATNQNSKLLIYGPKACSQLKPAATYAILGKLTSIYVEQKKWAQASKYAKQALEGFKAAKKGAGTSQAEWDKYVKRQRAIAHAAMGRNAAERRNWGGAISNYNQALRADSWAGLRGEAAYYTGLGRWRQGQIDAAMKAFARGSRQRGAPHAKHCREHLEKLYKSTHNDSLAGIEEFIAQL
jgi:tetratricopeptide (TPR) repeat protein